MFGRSRSTGARIPSRHRRAQLHVQHRSEPFGCQALERRTMLSTVTLAGTSGVDTIIIEVVGNEMFVDINGTMNAMPIPGTTGVVVNAGAGDDVIFLDSSAVPVTVNGDAGNDQLILSELSGDLGQITAPVTFNGGSEDDLLQIWDDLAVADDTYTVTATTVGRTGLPLLSYSQAESLELRAQAGNNAIHIDSLSNGMSVQIFAGEGNDTFRLGQAGGSLDPLEGFLILDGGEGIDEIVLNDRANEFNDAWSIDDDTVIRDFWFGATYNAMELITVNAGLDVAEAGADVPVNPRRFASGAGESGNDGSNTFNIEITNGATPVVINAGGGNDLIRLAGIADNLDSIASPVTVNGEAGIDSIVLNDRANPFDDEFTITETTISRLVFGGVTFGSVESVTLNAGLGATGVAQSNGRTSAAEDDTGSNLITISGVAPGVALVVNAGGGDDVIRLGGGDLAGILGSVTLDGESGNDSIEYDDHLSVAARNYIVSTTGVTATGLVNPLATMSNFEALSLRANAGPNVISVSNTLATMPVTIDAGAGDDLVSVDQTHADSPVTVRSGDGADEVRVNYDGTGSAQVIFDGPEDLQHLAIGSNGRAVIAGGAGGANSMLTRGIEMTGNAVLDITDNALAIDYVAGASPLVDVRASIITGYAGGAWTGSGITSSTAAATPQHGVGYAESSSLFGTFPVQFAWMSIDDSAVLVRYTRYGDANLDGLVNLADFNRLAGNFGQADKDWSGGDMNYDGLVNLADFNRLAGNFGLSATLARSSAADELDVLW